MGTSDAGHAVPYREDESDCTLLTIPVPYSFFPVASGGFAPAGVASAVVFDSYPPAGSSRCPGAGSTLPSATDGCTHVLQSRYQYALRDRWDTPPPWMACFASLP